MENRQLPTKSASQRCIEWVFRDVPSDITIEADDDTFSLNKLSLQFTCLSKKRNDASSGRVVQADVDHNAFIPHCRHFHHHLLLSQSKQPKKSPLESGYRHESRREEENNAQRY